MQSVRTATLIFTIAATVLGTSPALGQVPVRPPASNRVRPAQPPRANQVSPPPTQQRAQPRQQAQQRGQSSGSQPSVTPADESAAADRNNQRAASQRRGRFQLDFDKADIADVIQTISDFTGRLFIVPDNIRGKITIIGPEDGTGLVTADEAYAAFLAGLEANNWTVYPVGRYLKLVEKRAAAQTNTWTYIEPDAVIPDDERMITKVIRLNYVTTDAVANPLKQLMSKDASVIPMPPDTMIVTEVALNLRRIERILSALDQPGGGDELRLIQIEYATAAEISEKLLQIFETDSGQPSAARGRTVSPRGRAAAAAAAQEGDSAGGDEQGAPSITRVIPDERTNQLIVIANRKAFEQIENLIRQLDIPTGDSGRINVYYLENASAEDLASTLQTLTSSSGQTQAGRAPTRRGREAQAAAAASAAEFSGEVRISADQATNSLVVMASAEDYKNLTKVIEKLDIPRRQVFVEAVIMEVNLSDTDELGFSWHTGAGVDTSEGVAPIVLGSQVGQASSLNLSSLISMGGFLAGMQGPPISAAAELGVALPSFGVVMHAMTRNSNVNVLSTPHILTADNEEAEITVGQNVPFQAGFAPSGLSNLINQGTTGTAIGGGLLGTAGLGSLFAPIQRQNVELRLKIKPQINESDHIRMEVEEQTEEIAENDPVLGPTTAKRTAKTVVVAQDQTTVVLGGLIQERTIRSVQKTPILGDIPVVGRLFRDTSTQKTKTNLLLFLTPYIIRDQSDFRRIFERKMKEREEFLAAFYGTSAAYEVPIDFARKAGPLATLTRDVTDELMKVENGGPGAPGETTIVPGRNRSQPLVEEEEPAPFDEPDEPEWDGLEAEPESGSSPESGEVEQRPEPDAAPSDAAPGAASDGEPVQE